jgi:hypothetical protein
MSVFPYTPVFGASRQSHYGRGSDEEQSGARTGKRGRRRVSSSLFERIQPDAAGIDCGQKSHFVAVAPERAPQPVREFRTFTADLHRLADWLAQCEVKTVAMESTGVYWIPVYEILEARGFEVILVNARDVHNVRGRKSDVADCEWLQQLHSVGLLRASFRPAAANRAAALLPARARNPGPGSGDSHPTHAEGADPDECYAPHRDQRYHRRNRA